MINQPAFLDRFTVISSDKNTAETYVDHVLSVNALDAFTLTALARPGVDLIACMAGHLDDIDDGGFRDPGADIWIEQHGDALIDALLKNHGIEIHADPDYPADDPGFYWLRGDLCGDTWDTPQEARLQALISIDLTLQAREADGVIVPPDMPDAQAEPDAPRDTAARFYAAILEGTETISAIGEQYGPTAIVNLFYLLGALAKNDAAGDAAAFIELEAGDPLRQCLDDIKRECPELAGDIDLGVAQISELEV